MNRKLSQTHRTFTGMPRESQERVGVVVRNRYRECILNVDDVSEAFVTNERLECQMRKSCKNVQGKLPELIQGAKCQEKQLECATNCIYSGPQIEKIVRATLHSARSAQPC